VHWGNGEGCRVAGEVKENIFDLIEICKISGLISSKIPGNNNGATGYLNEFFGFIWSF
jgi:hypothetical protein